MGKLNNLKKRIKNITLVRGAYFLWRNYFCNYRNTMAYCTDTVILTPPYLSEIRKMFSYMKTAH